MRGAQLNRSPEGLKEMLAEQVRYEIEMMRGTYLALRGPASLCCSQLIINALIESFCIHARNLIEFFESNAGPTDETAAARHFTNDAYKSFPNGVPPEQLKAKLNKQISHLSYGRTKLPEAKIGSEDRDRLMELVNNEVANFVRHLRPTYQQAWRPAASPLP